MTLEERKYVILHKWPHLEAYDGYNTQDPGMEEISDFPGEKLESNNKRRKRYKNPSIKQRLDFLAEKVAHKQLVQQTTNNNVRRKKKLKCNTSLSQWLYKYPVSTELRSAYQCTMDQYPKPW